VTAVMPMAPAQAAGATGAYSGTGGARLVHLSAVNIPGQLELADATVAPSSSYVSTAASPRSAAHATNANVQLLNAAINQNLVVDALQTAPPDHATGVHAELLTVPAAPVLTAEVTTADAHARWKNDDECITSGPLSNAITKLADAVVLPASPLGGDAVALDNSADPTGASVSQTTVQLVKQPATATNYAVRTTALTEVTSVSLLGGAVVVEVIAAPKVVATATGVAGTATVQVTQPVLEINGQTLVAGDTINPINIPGGPVVELTAGTVTSSVAANGTVASGSGNLLSLKLLSVLGEPLVELSVGDVSARSVAPAGGVNCAGIDPLRDSRKDSSVATVNAGETFTYTITVPNRGSSPLTNVKVVDTVTGSPALTLVSSVPAATSSSTNRWTFDLGTIQPNQVKTIVMIMKVPSSAAIGTDYSNKAVITATYAGETITKTVTTPYPSVDGPGSGPCDLSTSTKFASHRQVVKGQTFTYYINAFNQGGQACNDIVVKDALHSGVSFVSCTFSCTRSGQLVTWKLDTLASGASRTLAVTVKVLASSGRLPNTADITPANGTGASPSTPGPVIGSSPILAPSQPARRGPGSDLPRTGGVPLFALAGLTLLAAAYTTRRLRKV